MSLDPQSGELDLRDLLRVIRRRKKVVLLVVLVCLSASVAISQLQPKRFASTAEILLQPRLSEAIFNANAAARTDPARQILTEIKVLESEPVKAGVRARIGNAPRISASPAGDTDVMEVRAEHRSPRRAADIANAYADSYISFRRDQSVEDLSSATRKLQAKIAELDKQIASADPSQKEELIQVRLEFRQEVDKLQIVAQLKTGGAEVVTPAFVAARPFSPRPVRNGVLALVFGLMLGTGLSFLREYLDDSVKSAEDLERATATIPSLGLIPAVPGWRSREEPRLISRLDPTSPVAEAYRTLRTAVQFLALDRPVRIIQVTSPSAGEGKTTTVANLAIALASAGSPVAVVCCDLRRPRVHEFFELSNAVGLTSVLLGDHGITAALQPVPGVKNLHLLASGTPPPNPSELLSTQRVGDVLSLLRDEGYTVLVDSAPVLPVTDAHVLSRWVDSTLLVCSAGRTKRHDAARAVELLGRVDAPVVGTVLNGVAIGQHYPYRYRYAEHTDRDREAKARRPPLQPSKPKRAPAKT